VNPRTDLLPICPNCHYIVHRRDPPYSVPEMKKIMHAQGKADVGDS
jgi:5-methylcytosine-specific restriction protein A